MQIIQETRTVIKAEDGKVLRKKTTGRVVGDTVHLGYDYYEAGILLKEPHLSTPDDYEEVDLIAELDENGNEIKVAPPDNALKRLQTIYRVVSEEIKNINSYNFTTEEKQTVKNLFARISEELLKVQE